MIDAVVYHRRNKYREIIRDEKSGRREKQEWRREWRSERDARERERREKEKRVLLRVRGNLKWVRWGANTTSG